MKYGLKTAVHVTDEFTKENVIEFFEAIKSNCNKINAMPYAVYNINIGDRFFICIMGYLTREKIEIIPSDYIILEGIPSNWREEMETPEIGKDTETFTELLQVKINQLQSRVKELEECLSKIIKCTRQSGNGRNRLNDNKLGVFHTSIDQAKQLLNK